MQCTRGIENNRMKFNYNQPHTDKSVCDRVKIISSGLITRVPSGGAVLLTFNDMFPNKNERCSGK